MGDERAISHVFRMELSTRSGYPVLIIPSEIPGGEIPFIGDKE